MSLKKIVTVIGARPQFIKAAPISRLLKDHSKIKEAIVHTGQHFDKSMSSIFFEELNIPNPDHSLNIHSDTHGQMTGKMLSAVEDVILSEQPDAVMVYGDTNSTLAGALAASKLNIPVIHVESGLRSYNRSMPEEINRVLTDHLSEILFCPTHTSINNLTKEGITKGIYHVGDVMYDAVLYARDYLEHNSQIFDRFLFINDPFCVLTVHRAQATKSRESLKAILEYAHNFACDHDLKIIFPVHPRTRNLIPHTIKKFTQINYCEPVSYLEMHALLSKAKYVLTDSGGLQKEAYFHRVPCITLRDETEWTETIQSGWNMLWNQNYGDNPRTEIDEYGAGDTSQKIIQIIENYFFDKTN
jgi:UDP-GlcNAc3NAcA epimerase